MPSQKLTPAQVAKKAAADKKFHENPNKRTSANTIRSPKGLATIDSKLAALIEPSLVIVNDLIIGKDVPKAQADTAKWVLLQAVSMKKTILDNKMQKLKLQLEELKVKPPENIPPATPKDLPNNVIDITRAVAGDESDWDNEQEFNYEEDIEEEVENDS